MLKKSRELTGAFYFTFDVFHSNFATFAICLCLRSSHFADIAPLVLYASSTGSLIANLGTNCRYITSIRYSRDWTLNKYLPTHFCSKATVFSNSASSDNFVAHLGTELVFLYHLSPRNNEVFDFRSKKAVLTFIK